MKKLKKLAKEAYNSKEVCQEWKDKILEAYPEVKPKLEVGKWYKGKTSLGSIFLGVYDNKKNKYSNIVYGFWNGKWSNNDNGLVWVKDVDAIELATEEEVSEALIKEAKRRGFKKGCEIIKSLNRHEGIMSDENPMDSKNEYYYDLDNDSIFVNRSESSNICIYKNGKWAEIIEQEPEEIKVNYEEVKPKVIELDGVKYRLTEIKK